MTTPDILRALLVVLIWGMNFVAIKIGLQHIPPFALGAIRFAMVALPAVFFIAHPRLPWRLLLAYGLSISFGQFAFLFVAMRVGMPAGLASLVLQASAVFTVVFSAAIFKEKIFAHQIIGMLISVFGLVVLASFSMTYSAPNLNEVSLIGFVLTLCAAASWALGNVVSKHIARTQPVPLLSLVVWGGLISIPFFVGCAFWFEGADVFGQVAAHVTWQDAAALAYIAYLATLVGYVHWGNLLAKYPAAWIAPLTLIVPPIGLTAAFVWFDERLAVWQMIGIVIIMMGLLMNVFGHRLGWQSSTPRG